MRVRNVVAALGLPVPGRCVAAAVFALSMGVGAARPFTLAAQVSDSSASAAGPLFTGRDAVYAGAFIGVTAALVPFDRRLEDALQHPAAQTNHILHTGATGFRLLGSPGATVLAGTMFLAGTVTHHRDVAALGLHTTEAIFLADALSGVHKTLLGRARPYQSPENPYDFRFARGFQGDRFRSFPSGHTTSAFAAAAASSAELSRWWPHYHVLIGGVLYGGASLVGFSRVYNHDHWPTDVVIGAAIGTFAGRKVVTYTHDHPKNRLDRLLLSGNIVPAGHGKFLVSVGLTPISSADLP